MVRAALELAEDHQRRSARGLAGADDLGKLDGDLRLYDDAIEQHGDGVENRAGAARRRGRACAPIRAFRIPKARRSIPIWAAAFSPIRAASWAAIAPRAAA